MSDRPVIDYGRVTAPYRVPPAFPVSGRITRAAGIWSILLVMAALPFFHDYMIVRDYLPHWRQWVTPIAVFTAFPLAVLAMFRDANGRRRGAPGGLVALIFSGGCLLYMACGQRGWADGESADRVRCAGHLRMIGQAMMSYASSHGHAYPPSFATLYMNGDIGSEFFVCPKTNHRPARGPTTVAIAAKLAGPPNGSYIYLAAGMTDAAPASAILAYEPASNHDGCSNALFGDGHVEFLTPTELKTALAPPVATVPTWPVLVTTRPVTSAPTAN